MFAPARLAAGPRPWLPAATLALVAFAVIAAGTLLDRPDSPDRSNALVAEQPAPSPQPPRATAAPLPATDRGIGRLPAALMTIEARPSGRHVFVNGDVFSMAAFLVVVSLEEQDTVTATRTVSLPGGSTAFLTGANPRFVVQFDVAEAKSGPLFIRANAYDTHGDIVSTLRQAVLAQGAGAPSSAAR